MFGNDFPVYPSPSEQSAADGAQNQKLDDADKKIVVFFFHNSIPFSAAKSMYLHVEFYISKLSDQFTNAGKKQMSCAERGRRKRTVHENGELLIRANQGHTVMTVESEKLLKQILSADENLESILESGLKRMKRLHVHFSSGLPTDGEVISGMRRDVNVLIYLDVRKALECFDGVVPVKCFEKIESWPDRKPIYLS
ncbi:hypothetical protein ES288_A09G140200v1 [Gossypium darwinii]|uniref:2'-phosphotransferase n=1 Tax=Gossypium darwinii TaxID=34276 RepID=A0A5D2FAD7_GOSDA|nr:hypothetical protein ES288_A09G140200v1 [Gossypium darwinii]